MHQKTPAHAIPIPRGESPRGTGESPVLPEPEVILEGL